MWLVKNNLRFDIILKYECWLNLISKVNLWSEHCT